MAATSEIEEGLTLRPKFDADGLVTAVATDAATGELLMVAHMNAEALALTLDGKPFTLGPASSKSTLVFFRSSTCPVCKMLLPVLKSLKQAEAQSLSIVIASDGDALEHAEFRRAASLTDFPYVLSRDLGMTFRINRLPFAVLLDEQGVVRGKGLVNSREQL